MKRTSLFATILSFAIAPAFAESALPPSNAPVVADDESAAGLGWDMYRREGRTYQLVRFVSTSEASCEVRRDGSTIASLRLSTGDDDASFSMGTVPVDVTDNHNRIDITCWRQGYHPRSTVAEWRRRPGFFRAPPCAKMEHGQQQPCEGGHVTYVMEGEAYDSWLILVLKRIDS